MNHSEICKRFRVGQKIKVRQNFPLITPEQDCTYVHQCHSVHRNYNSGVVSTIRTIFNFGIIIEDNINNSYRYHAAALSPYGLESILMSTGLYERTIPGGTELAALIRILKDKEKPDTQDIKLGSTQLMSQFEQEIVLDIIRSFEDTSTKVDYKDFEDGTLFMHKPTGVSKIGNNLFGKCGSTYSGFKAMVNNKNRSGLCSYGNSSQSHLIDLEW